MAGLLIRSQDKLDTWEEKLFYGKPLSRAQQIDLLDLACSQINTQGSFCLARDEIQAGIQVLTGEKLKTRQAVAHSLALRTVRLLYMFNLQSGAQEVIRSVDQLIETSCYASFCAKGECIYSTLSLIRCLSARGSGVAGKHLEALVHKLVDYRDGTGSWRSFPFYYTLLSLYEAGTPEAIGELVYAAPACDRRLMRTAGGDKFIKRRVDLLKKILKAI